MWPVLLLRTRMSRVATVSLSNVIVRALTRIARRLHDFMLVLLSLTKYLFLIPRPLFLDSGAMVSIIQGTQGTGSRVQLVSTLLVEKTKDNILLLTVLLKTGGSPQSWL